jgi:hypothetical protein
MRLKTAMRQAFEDAKVNNRQINRPIVRRVLRVMERGAQQRGGTSKPKQ